jgi:hypothetical protein
MYYCRKNGRKNNNMEVTKIKEDEWMKVIKS